MAESPVPYLSIVIPTYRGVGTLATVVHAVLAATSEYSREIIIVDDGSPEDEQARIRAMVAAIPAATVLCLPENRGQQGASLIGLAAARGSVVVTLDDDGDHPPALIPTMVAALDRADLVYAAPRGAPPAPGAGRPRGRRHPLRRLGTALNNRLFTRWLGKPRAVPVTSYRAIDGAVLRRALTRPVSFPYLSAMLFSEGARATAVFYESSCGAPGPAADAGSSRYRLRRLVGLFWRLYLYWGPLRGFGRILRPPRPLDLSRGCR